jgi:hypothetical protein
MGRASREKWIKRAEAFEDIAHRSVNPESSKAYIERFSRKLQKFVKGARELAEERVEDAVETPDHEPEG